MQCTYRLKLRWPCKKQAHLILQMRDEPLQRPLPEKEEMLLGSSVPSQYSRLKQGQMEGQTLASPLQGVSGNPNDTKLAQLWL